MARKTASPEATPAKREPVSIFKTASKAPKVAASAGASAKPLVPVPGLMLDAMSSEGEKICRSLKETVFRPGVKSVGHSVWIDEAVKHHRRPENFRGVEASLDSEGRLVTNRDFQASIELRKRGTNSPLKDEEMEVLEADGIPFAHAPLKEGTSTFQLNPAYETDERLHQWGAQIADPITIAMDAVRACGVAPAAAEKIEATMRKQFVEVPSDLLVQSTKPVVTEDTLHAAFALRPGESETQYKDRLNRVMPIVTIVGVKPSTKLGEAEVLQHLLDYVKRDQAQRTADHDKSTRLALELSAKVA